MNMNKMEERTRKTPAAAKPPASTTKIKPATAPPAAKKTVAAHVGKAPLAPRAAPRSPTRRKEEAASEGKRELRPQTAAVAEGKKQCPPGSPAKGRPSVAQSKPTAPVARHSRPKTKAKVGPVPTGPPFLPVPPPSDEVQSWASSSECRRLCAVSLPHCSNSSSALTRTIETIQCASYTPGRASRRDCASRSAEPSPSRGPLPPSR